MTLATTVAMALVDHDRRALGERLAEAMSGMCTRMRALERYLGGADEDVCVERVMATGFSLRQAEQYLCIR